MNTLTEISAIIEDRIRNFSFDDRQPAELYAPMKYILSMGGKRIRPAVVLAAFQAFSDEPLEEALPFALAVEVFHNFTLAHDDIMDAAPERRGRPTLHIKWNTNTAILSGDALFAFCYELMSERVSRPYFGKVFKLFNQTVFGVCEGQMMDLMQAERHFEVFLPDYLEMIRKKTAVLIGGALAIGAAGGGASNEDVNRILTFGETVGIAFQLRDDLLDLYGQSEKVGKQTGGDILEKKKNVLYLLTCEKLNDGDRAEFIRLYFQNEEIVPPGEKVARVKEIYDRLNIKESTEELILKYYRKAEETLAPLESKPGIGLIKDLFTGLMERES